MWWQAAYYEETSRSSEIKDMSSSVWEQILLLSSSVWEQILLLLLSFIQAWRDSMFCREALTIKGRVACVSVPEWSVPEDVQRMSLPPELTWEGSSNPDCQTEKQGHPKWAVGNRSISLLSKPWGGWRTESSESSQAECKFCVCVWFRICWEMTMAQAHMGQ